MKAENTAPAGFEIAGGAVPGAAVTIVALGDEDSVGQAVNQPVAAQSTQGGEGGIEAILTDAQHVFGGVALGQLVGYHADDLPAGLQAGELGGTIGTSGVAILAKHYGIPFYVLGPTSTIDMRIASGDEIVIEQRKPEEVTEMWYEKRMAPEGVKVYNPAFDVTDHELITGIVTEHGIAYPPYTESLKKLFEK